MGNVVTAKEIAIFLKSKLHGNNINISTVSSLNSIKENSLTFTKKNKLEEEKICPKTLIITPLDFIRDSNDINCIKVSNPRLSFAETVQEFFLPKQKYEIHETAKISQNCNIANNVSIGAYSVIGENVSIGKNTIINSHVVIHHGTIIGDNCYIKSGSIIGEDGFGFEFNNNQKPIRVPHIGKVIIGNSVEIGAKNTIARGTIDDTIIGDNVKIDDQVHIGHNCNIGQNTIITACVEISGSVTIGQNCWIGPNASIIQKVSIGDNTTIGIGTIITENIGANKKVMSLNGLELRKLVKLRKRIDYGK